MTKLLRDYSDDDDVEFLYGFYSAEDDSVNVNVEKIWGETQDVDEFISLFVETLIHEELHRLIHHIIKDNQKFFKKKRLKYSEVGEEYCVKTLNGEFDDYYSFQQFLLSDEARDNYDFEPKSYWFHLHS